jgi:hypothetical protein
MAYAEAGAFAEGYAASRDGIACDTNPHAPWSGAHTAWTAGWERGAADAGPRLRSRAGAKKAEAHLNPFEMARPSWSPSQSAEL